MKPTVSGRFAEIIGRWEAIRHPRVRPCDVGNSGRADDDKRAPGLDDVVAPSSCEPDTGLIAAPAVVVCSPRDVGAMHPQGRCDTATMAVQSLEMASRGCGVCREKEHLLADRMKLVARGPTWP